MNEQREFFAKRIPSISVENIVNSKARKEIEKNSNGCFRLVMWKIMHCGIYQGTNYVGGIQPGLRCRLG